MTNEKLVISVFGDKAEEITEGQKFIAMIDFVEGRKVVKLSPIPEIRMITGFDQRGDNKR